MAGEVCSSRHSLDLVRGPHIESCDSGTPDIGVRPSISNKADPARRGPTRSYCAALTEFTVMVLSFSVPMTVTFAPACLSSVARAALSLVSSV